MLTEATLRRSDGVSPDELDGRTCLATYAEVRIPHSLFFMSLVPSLLTGSPVAFQRNSPNDGGLACGGWR